MMKKLTQEQQVFAAEHYSLIGKYLHMKRLPERDYFDIVVFGYLQAVQDYLTKDTLNQYAFQQIAFRRMRACVLNYWHAQKAQKRCATVLSLDAVPETGYGLAEVIPDPGSNVEEAVMAHHQAGAVLHLVESCVKPQQQRVIRLRANGLPYREIADACQISVGSVNYRLFTCRRQLRTAYSSAEAMAA